MRHTQAEKQAFIEARATEMRAQPEPAERALYAILDSMGNWEFQVPIMAETKNGGEYPYIADALLRRLKLIVEVDGSSHRRKQGRDRRRDTRLATMGYVTLRVSNREVLKRPNEVRVKIAVALDRLEQGLAYT